jgi:hypothetical protein
MHKKYLIILISAVLLLSSCYGINEKNSYILTLSNCCNSDIVWKKIFSKYKPEGINTVEVQGILNDFKSQPFKTNIIYFKDEPEEYVGISENGRFIRYVYNKKISTQVLDGLSTKLSDSEKIRIGLRINSILFNYLNEDGRMESVFILKESFDEFLKTHQK